MATTDPVKPSALDRFLRLFTEVKAWELASLPGKKARERKHPQAEAIGVLGWVGLLFGGVGWAVALVWAYTTPIVAVVQAGATPAQIGKAVEEAVEKAQEAGEES